MRKTKQIKVGKIKIGGGAPIAVQSMCNTLTTDVDATIKQIHELEAVGCEIVRVSVPNIKSVNCLKEIKENISIPLVADVHFSYKLAVECAKYVDKLRINPGNIKKENFNEIVKAAKEYNIPIRLGINLGSLEPELEQKYGLSAKAMVESALTNVRLLEKLDFYDIIVSLKASDVLKTVEANRIFSTKSNYPLHLGITEAGPGSFGVISSSIGIGSLLLEGIGDTIRVSLSTNPVEEVKVAWHILKALDLRQRGVKIIACPSCARANIDVVGIAKKLEELTSNIKKSVSVAIMGCVVNFKEVKSANLAVIGGKISLLYKDGKVIKKIKEKEIIDSLLEEIELYGE